MNNININIRQILIAAGVDAAIYLRLAEDIDCPVTEALLYMGAVADQLRMMAASGMDDGIDVDNARAAYSLLRKEVKRRLSEELVKLDSIAIG